MIQGQRDQKKKRRQEEGQATDAAGVRQLPSSPTVSRQLR